MQEGLSPKENSKKNLMEDPEETAILKSREPQLLKGPGEHGNGEFSRVSGSSYAGEGAGDRALTSLGGRGL